MHLLSLNETYSIFSKLLFQFKSIFAALDKFYLAKRGEIVVLIVKLAEPWTKMTAAAQMLLIAERSWIPHPFVSQWVLEAASDRQQQFIMKLEEPVVFILTAMVADTTGGGKEAEREGIWWKAAKRWTAVLWRKEESVCIIVKKKTTPKTVWWWCHNSRKILF